MKQPGNSPQSGMAYAILAAAATPDGDSLEELRRAAFLHQSARYLGLIPCAHDIGNRLGLSSESAFSADPRWTN